MTDVTISNKLNLITSTRPETGNMKKNGAK